MRHLLRRTTAILSIALTIGSGCAPSPQQKAAALSKLSEAKIEMEKEDWLPAIHLLDEAISNDPNLPTAHLERARAINKYCDGIMPLGKYPSPDYTRKDAMRDLDEEIRLNPKLGEAFYLRACTWLNLADPEKARADFTNAIARMEDPTEAYVGRAFTWTFAGDFRNAANDMTCAIDRHPLEAEYYYKRGGYRRMISDNRNAVFDFAKSSALEKASGKLTMGALKAVERNVGGQQDIMAPQRTPEVAADLSRLEGRWEVVRMERIGVPVDVEPNEAITTFHNGESLAVRNGVKRVQRISLDPAKHPRQIDFRETSDGRTKVFWGIYETVGDTLRICSAPDDTVRPTDFTTAIHFERLLVVYKRSKR
jgi:uncharacterized protein (TIGR03067 family)